mmetsp:Transcript_25091/g.54609  ORF Transcript_25091/g.54609 Transcript_25091/m.54609 type:complete len:505 (-) Transcript_25091:251-1765(-)
MEGTPLVVVHGLFGWGTRKPLFGMFPSYFPIRCLQETWRKGPVVVVDVGCASSDHDRACEIFAQLVGCCTDYGEEHAKECGHSRYGKDFSGQALLKRWDGAHPVHLLGHSFGGNTAAALIALLAEDFWSLGTNVDWVLSLTCICSPLRGCSLVYAATGASAFADGKFMIRRWSPSHLMTIVMGIWLRMQVLCPGLKGLYDMRMDHWGQEPITLPQLRETNHPYWLSGDNVAVGSLPMHNHRGVKKRLSALSRTRLIAVIADGLEPVSPQVAFRAVFRICIVVALTVAAARRLKAMRLSRGWREKLAQAKLLAMAGSIAILLLVVTSPPEDDAKVAFWDTWFERQVTNFHDWINRPMLRLMAYVLMKTSSGFSDASGKLATRCGFARGRNDGVIDLASQRWLDAPGLRSSGAGRGRKDSTLRNVRSSESSMAFSAAESALGNSFSEVDLRTALHDRGGQAALEHGKWHVLHIPDSDHVLGTSFSSHSLGMYKTVLPLLESITRQR